jgi:hypothetical protein
MSKLDTFLIELDKAEANDSGQRAALDRFHEASRTEAESVAARLLFAEAGAGDFTVYELLFAAGARCVCGAGMAYPDNIGMHGAWYCSAILLGQAAPGTEHSPAYPFAFYKVKSEAQPTQAGATTRPKGTHVETEPTYACHYCGNTGKWPRYRTDEQRPKDLACSKCGARYLNSDGSSNSKIHTRWFHVVVDDEVEGETNKAQAAST